MTIILRLVRSDFAMLPTPAGSIGKCKFSEKFEELLFWR